MDTYTIGSFINGLLDDIRNQPINQQAALLRAYNSTSNTQARLLRGEIAYKLRKNGTPALEVAEQLQISERLALALVDEHTERNKLPRVTRARSNGDLNARTVMPQ